MKRLHTVITLLLLFAVTTCAVLSAREAPDGNNPWKINDECYKYFVKARQHMGDSLILVYGDSMRLKALEVGDNKAYVISLLQPLTHYTDLYDLDKMQECMEAVQAAAKKYGYMQYYFNAYAIVINAHLRNAAYNAALQLAQKMQTEARAENNAYGIWDSYSRLGGIYVSLNNLPEAKKNYEAAIALGHTVPEQSLCSIYRNLTNISQTREEADKYMQKALEAARHQQDSMQVLQLMAEKYFAFHDTANFLRVYDEITHTPAYPVGLSSVTRIMLNAKRFEMVGRYEDAFCLLRDSIDNRLLIHHTNLESCARRNKDWLNAYIERCIADSIRLAANREAAERDLAAINAKMRNDSLKAANEIQQHQLAEAAIEQARMQAENDKLVAEQARAEAERARTAAEAAQAQAEAARQEAENQLLVADRQRQQAQLERANLERQEADTKRKAAELKAQQQRTKYMMIIASVCMLLLTAAVLALAYWIYARRRTITELRKLNEQLDHARQEAINANHMKDLFVQNMSHEIRTPLNAVMGFSQILTCPGMPISDEEKEEYGAHIMNNVNLLTMLVDDILNVSDIETGNYKITLRENDIDAICQSAISVTQYRIPVGVDFRYTNLLPPGYTCIIDARRSQQVLVNYLSNACKHTTSGYIELKAEVNEELGYLKFTVTDTGEGVPPDQAQNIFERFTKLNNFVQGTGLGLNICSSVAKKLNGHVWLDTSYTGGARFCFDVPLNLKPNEN